MKFNLYRFGGAIQLVDPNDTVIRHEKGVFPVFIGTIEVTEPKKVVTKELDVAHSQLGNTFLHTLGVAIPNNAYNLRLLYDIEE